MSFFMIVVLLAAIVDIYFLISVLGHLDFVMLIASFITICFFLALMAHVNKLAKDIRNDIPGFLIDEKGVTDNSGLLSVGFMPWDDIVHIRMVYAKGNSFIIIDLRNPDIYISREKFSVKRLMLKMYNNIHGSPMRITTGKLKINKEDLYQMLTRKFREIKAHQL